MDKYQIDNSIVLILHQDIYRHLEKAFIAGVILLLTSCNPYKRYHKKYCSHDISTYKIISALDNLSNSDTTFIKGRVIEKDGIAVIGATIISEDNSINKVSNIDGEFEAIIPNSSYSDSTIVNVKSLGFTSLNFKLKDVKNNEIELVLSPEPGCTVGEMVIIEPAHKRIWKKITGK